MTRTALTSVCELIPRFGREQACRCRATTARGCSFVMGWWSAMWRVWRQLSFTTVHFTGRKAWLHKQVLLDKASDTEAQLLAAGFLESTGASGANDASDYCVFWHVNKMLECRREQARSARRRKHRGMLETLPKRTETRRCSLNVLLDSSILRQAATAVFLVRHFSSGRWLEDVWLRRSPDGFGGWIVPVRHWDRAANNKLTGTVGGATLSHHVETPRSVVETSPCDIEPATPFRGTELSQ